MTTIINAATSGGLIQTADTSGELQLQTASTAAVTINASQKVGVGATPYTWWAASKALQVGTTTAFEDLSAGTTIFNNSYRDAGGSSVYATTAPASRYVFSGNQHSLQGAASGTANTAVSWTALVAVELGKSVALQGASSQTGTGITFPATQSASSDANTLDDYEEGTWTPTAVGNTDAGTTTYVLQVGKYTKIGNVVNATGFIAISAMTGTGNLHLSLPFATNSNINIAGSTGTYDLNWPSAGSICSFAVASNAYARLHVSVDNGADVIVQTENASWEAYYTISYQI
jgi:hypothetical protein